MEGNTKKSMLIYIFLLLLPLLPAGYLKGVTQKSQAGSGLFAFSTLIIIFVT